MMITRSKLATLGLMFMFWLAGCTMGPIFISPAPPAAAPAPTQIPCEWLTATAAATTTLADTAALTDTVPLTGTPPVSPTLIITLTPPLTLTVTGTVTPPLTSTLQPTLTATSAVTATAEPTTTATPTQTLTGTVTPVTPAQTVTGTVTPVTPTQTLTGTITPVTPGTPTGTAQPPSTPRAPVTGTPSAPTPTAVATIPPTATATPLPSPTLTRTATATPSPTPTGGTPPDTPTPAPVGQVYLRSHRGFASDGAFTVVGEAVNATSAPIFRLTIAATFFNDSGQMVATQEGFGYLVQTSPDQRNPFRIQVSNPSNDISRYDLALSWEEISVVTYQDLAILRQEVTEDGRVEVTGELQNDFDENLGSVVVVVTLYDEQGEVVDVYQNVPAATQLAPGETTSFAIPITTNEPFTTFSVQAQGRRAIFF
jgi:hypothetical protein